jgi:flagellar biosynthesis component FlhA
VNIVKNYQKEIVMSKKKAAKKTAKKTVAKKKPAKAKDINVVVPIPAPIPISIPVTIPTDLKLIDRLKSIKDKVFSTFGFGPPEIPND